jgi:hypothetical protein
MKDLGGVVQRAQGGTLGETKELVRHANIQTTSDIYGGLSLDA